MQQTSQLRGDRPTLRTERLLLRRPEYDDIEAIVRIAGDWEIARRLARMPHPYGAAEARYFLDEIVPNEFVWAATSRETGEIIAIIGLAPEPDQREAELGYYVSRDWWGHGIATEAGRAVVAYGIDVLALDRIFSGHFADNPGSGRVLLKLGFAETGRGERFCLAEGSMKPSVEMELRRNAS